MLYGVTQAFLMTGFSQYSTEQMAMDYLFVLAAVQINRQQGARQKKSSPNIRGERGPTAVWLCSLAECKQLHTIPITDCIK